MWSKLRVKLKSFITEELRNRIDIHLTRYHDAHDGYGEIWITLDEKKIFGGGYYHWYMTPVPDELLNSFQLKHGFHKDFYKVNIESKNVEEIMRYGVHETSHILINLDNYINTSFSESLTSNNPIYKAFSLIDRRLGRRRFEGITLSDDEHPLVKIFYKLRQDCFK
ncbi:SF0329 family protein [Gordoniibacillus kamchatkensis]|uniref:SF0329 family protein n=1 Tax=Gordoniibacillus kamchatkensis TaxID=1590651 RepID=UPI0012E0179A|nr:hypothetical protein [Paenibacillus sp. VKM B-2647]